MVKLRLDLGELGGSDAPQTPYKPDPLDDIFSTALESKSGVALKYATKEDAIAMRFRLYRRRRTLQAKNVCPRGFEDIIIRIDGTSLLITRQAPFQLQEL
jgi:hypothetical protein